MQLQFLAPVELFFKAVERLQFLTRAELIYFLISKGSRRANYWILTQGGDKKEQYTSIRTMTDCICTLTCGAAIGTFALRELECFRQARVVN